MSKEPKLIHKLLISFKLSPEKPISGNVFAVTLILKNIGDSAFSGGQFTQFFVRFPSNTYNLDVDRLAKIPAIGVGESKESSPCEFLAMEDGAGWMGVSIKSADEAEVHLYQTSSYDMGISWGNAILIAKREYVEIINLLREIVALLKKRGEKQ